MSNNKTCNICFDNQIHNRLQCTQCKNKVCDLCYANIIFNENFNIDFMHNKAIFKCPFCKTDNNLSTEINPYNTNLELIKLSIKKMNKEGIEFNNLVDDINELRLIIKNLNYENSNLKTMMNHKMYIEYKPNKLDKIASIIKNTKRNTILYNEIQRVLLE